MRIGKSSGESCCESCSLGSSGSGQLAYDTQQCVRTNALGLAPAVWRRWTAAFERPGLIMLCHDLLVLSTSMFTKVYHNGKASPAPPAGHNLFSPCTRFLRSSTQHCFAGLLHFANGSSLEDFGQCLEMHRARLESQDAWGMWDGSTLCYRKSSFSEASCKSVLAALAASTACQGHSYTRLAFAAA